MADYTYRISASGTATGANAGFTTIAAAISDFKGADRMGAGAGKVAANSTLYFLADGFTSQSGCNLSGIDVTLSNAKIVVGPFSNRFNLIVRALGFANTFDGFDFGPSSQMNLGLGSGRQANLTIRDLIITSGNGGLGTIEAYGPADGSSNVQILNCFIRNSNVGSAVGVKLDGADLINSVVLCTSASGATLVINAGRPGGNKIDQSTITALGGSATWFVYNQNDPPPQVRNSYIGPVSSGMLGGGGTWPAGTTGNAIANASGFVTGTIYSVPLDTTNFTNVTAGSEDLRVKSTSVLKTTGAARLSGLTTDIFGTARSDPATIGAYEFVVVTTTTLTGSITLEDLIASGTFNTAVTSTLTTLPFTRNTGSRPSGLVNVSLAVLTDNASLASVIAASGLSQNPNGTFSLTNGVPLPAGTSVIVVSREADGKLGVSRATLT